MKLVSLNIWGGKAFDPLLQFIRDAAPDTDVFCFQEVFRSSSGIIESRGTRVNILQDLEAALPDFQAYFAPEQKGFDNDGAVDFDLEGGQATFVKKSISVGSEGTVFIYGEKGEVEGVDPTNLPANFHYIRVKAHGKALTVCNVHGVAYPGHKQDTPERLEQSRKIKEFLGAEEGRKILCGDFNLMPDTESLRMLEETMVNLVTKFKIPRTRSKLSPFYGKDNFQKFADYILVSPEIEVRRFEVPDLLISDHLPLVLEFS